MVSEAMVAMLVVTSQIGRSNYNGELLLLLVLCSRSANCDGREISQVIYSVIAARNNCSVRHCTNKLILLLLLSFCSGVESILCLLRIIEPRTGINPFGYGYTVVYNGHVFIYMCSPWTNDFNWLDFNQQSFCN